MTTAVNSSQAFHLSVLERKASDLYAFCDKFATVLQNNQSFNDGLGQERSTHLWDSLTAAEFTLPRLANAAKITTSENE